MNKEEHTKRHIKLHESLDELVGDAIVQAKITPSNTILTLMEWSCKQLKGVDHGEGSNKESES